MKVEFRLTEDEAMVIVGAMVLEHQAYYGTPHGAKSGLGLSRWRTDDDRRFRWRSSAGNELTIWQDGIFWTAFYRGKRHGLVHGGFLKNIVHILHAAQDRGHWYYVATSEKGWLPLETANDWPDDEEG